MHTRKKIQSSWELPPGKNGKNKIYWGKMGTQCECASSVDNGAFERDDNMKT